MLWMLVAAHAASPEAVSAYSAQHLFRSAFVVLDTGVRLADTYDPKLAPVPWGVFDGKGTLLTAEQFAEATKDSGVLARFRKEDAKARGTNTALTIVAIVAASLGTSADQPGAAHAEPGAAPEGSASWTAIVSQRPVSQYYTADLADQLIVSHNAGLRRKLGLSVEEAAALDGPPKP